MNEFGHVLTRAAGEPLKNLFQRRIAEPIGMDPAKWDWGDFGAVDGVVVNGGSGNHGKHVRISARELGRFGLLFLNRGRWDGRQLISDRWVAAATRVSVAADLPWAQPESKIDGRGVYGFNWWANGTKSDGRRLWPSAPVGTFAALGYNNNRCFVIPEWDTVVVRLGTDGNVEDAVWEKFLGDLAAALETR
jgi:CubicO group peptidase (beta-lactamase class C family)